MNGANDKSMSVKIAGEIINVYAEEGQEYITRMSNYINYIVNEFNKKKGPNVRQPVQLAYAALELCNTLFTERDSRMSESERNFEKMFQMEVFSHKRTQDTLDAVEKRLADAERRLAEMNQELDEFVKAFDAEHKDG